MKRIKKVSQTVPTYGQIVDGHANTTTDSYSTKYQNAHNVIVSSTTPTTDERVWFKHSRNIASDTTLKNGLWTSASGISTNASGWYVIESIKPNKTYTITKKNTTGTIVVNATATKPANGVSTNNRQNVSGSTKVNFTTNATDKYLFIGLFAGSPTETQKAECIEELQVVEGNEEIPYEPYIQTPSINVDGDEIYHVDSYSTTEVKTNKTWIDGKPIYRKVYDISTITTSNTNLVDISSLKIENLIKLYGYIKDSYTGMLPIPLTDSSSNYSVILYNGQYIRGRCALGSGGAVSSAYAIIEYTKTTD